MATSLRELLASTPLSGGNAPYVEALYEQFLADPQSCRRLPGATTSSICRMAEAARRRRRRADPLHRAGRHRAARQRSRAWPPGRRRHSEHRCRRQAGRGFAPGADLRQPWPPDRQARSAGPAEARAPARAGARLLRADRCRPRYGIPHRLASERAQQDAETARDARAARIRLLRHDRRRVRARVRHRRAPVAAGSIPQSAASRAS